ncbi:leucine-rich repeat domain-containing protein [Pyxidicoccus caerfyrddinensis]|uniref:leucine-rich repeat domain-containing protein n=1 Tax=Pyxidicoccus caerfyrddinensis TaxID=2709663 RepID=UPI0013D9C03F|nr:leucine-rich repeat domain-containing protein [Pyxidicoccus caerfyrddinensis]
MAGSLEELDLSRNGLGDEGALALARSPHLAALEWLQLGSAAAVVASTGWPSDATPRRARWIIPPSHRLERRIPAIAVLLRNKEQSNMEFFRSRRACPWHVWGLACALVMSAWGCTGLPEQDASSDLETTAVGQPLAFSNPMDFSELRGLPPSPVAMDTTVQELLRILPSPRFDDVRNGLSRYPVAAKVRLLTSYARDYPVFLMGNKVLMPNHDGVIATQTPVVTAATVSEAACNSSHVCANLYDPQLLTPQFYSAIVIVAPRVELAAPVETGGTSLIIATGDYVSHDFPVITTPDPGTRSDAGTPHSVDSNVPAPSGRDGRNAGSFILYANVLKGVKAHTAGEKGEPGTAGNPALLNTDGGTTNSVTVTVTGDNGPNPTITCTVNTIYREAQKGGNGGDAGTSGDIVIRYASSIGPGLVNEPNKASPVTSEQCFNDDELHCQSLRCRWNPAIALCDMLTEADNAQCADGIDNDHNGYTDCDDYGCSKNPHVTVCPEASWSPLAKESSADACSDGVDNDGDGKVDCADTQCLARGICQKGRTADSEFSEAACGDGLDNDGDAYNDCDDYGCQNYSTVCGSKGEGGEEKCSDLIDNDGDGLGDCEDPGCSGTSVCNLGPALALTTGIEESTNAACSNGYDDDLDGDTDCADRECQVNPLVTVCGAERTLQNCTDGIDNDGDGKVDCADPGCDDNPYVKLCDASYYPFLQESNAATCSDGVDNDGDGYKDCADYQCVNSPLSGTVCGVNENTAAQCSDGVDNDGNGATDCADSTCRNNPFYGDLLCKKQVQTYHSVSVSGPYNGRYVSLAAELVSPNVAAGAKGFAGKRISREVTVTVVEAPPGTPCEFYDDYCTPHTETRSCYVGKTASAGSAGATAVPAKVKMLRVARRDVDMLRALLAPHVWRVSESQANALFKRGDLQKASFYYTQNIMELGGILAQANLECDVPPAADRSFPDKYLYGALCPLMFHDVTKLSYLQGQRNFYGLTKDIPFNPHLRYEALRAEFTTLHGVLNTSVQNWLTLSNGTQFSAWMAAHANELNDEVTALTQEASVADQRVAVANAAMNALLTSMDNRKAAISLLTENIQATDTRITNHYNTSGKGFGDFLEDLVKSVASAYGGQALTGLAGKAAEALWTDVKKTFKSETSPTPVAGSGPPASASNSFVSGLWTALKDSATDAAKSKPFKDKLSSGATALWDVVGGNQKAPARSILADEVKKEILSQSQVEIALDLMDLQAQLTKAQAEYQLALMERDTVLLRQRNAVAARDALQNIYAFGAGTELRQFDQILIGQQVYATALRTLDQLTSRYWELIRIAEYQYLPFDPSTGDSAIPATFRANYDFNLLNYQTMLTRLVDLDNLATHYGLSNTQYYRRLPGSSFHAMTADELAKIKSLGDVATGSTTFKVARFQVTADDLATRPELAARNGHRVRNVRINVVTTTGSTASVPAVLVRDTVDAYKLGGYVAEFELMEKDRYTSGGTRQVLHYIPFTACISAPPSCDVAQASCNTAFQSSSAFLDTCSVAPGSGGSTPATNSFYDRSLLGEWTLLVDSASFTGLGTVKAVEVLFMVPGTII